MKTDYQGIREAKKTLLTAGFTAATWQAGHVYALNALVKPVTSNGHYYRCTTAGTSHTTAPTWPPTFWGTVADNTVVWREEEPVSILDYDPVGFSYPCIIVGDITPGAEEQIAMGNVPANRFNTPLRIIAYQGGVIAKSWANMRKQAFDVLMQAQAIIRDNPTLNSYAGILEATSNEWIAPETVSAFYELQVLWSITLYLK